MINVPKLYRPIGIMREWPDAKLRDTFAPVVGYIPLYATLEALRAECGKVPYQIIFPSGAIVIQNNPEEDA